MVLKDGSMLISDDYNGAVYRVTYDGAAGARRAGAFAEMLLKLVYEFPAASKKYSPQTP
jgi:hypothetical protein